MNFQADKRAGLTKTLSPTHFRYNAPRLNRAKALYHRLVPASIRNPFGLLRRDVTDRLKRIAHRGALPPRELLERIQMTPWVDEYVRIGARSAASVRRLLAPSLDGRQRSRVLDFGCGSGRALLQLKDTSWELYGCDVDAGAIEWLRQQEGEERFRITDPDPPLPWPDATFDAIYSVSVFTHFSETAQKAWIAELARVLGPDGLLVVSTMGPSVLPNFPVHCTPKNRDELKRSGFFFVPSGESFNANAAFHSASGLIRLFSPHFTLRAWLEQGLDGFQDLSLWKKS